MTRRGYDIVQVRDFLREIASEMRERQRVRDQLAQTGDGEAAGEVEAKKIISNAKGTAAGIIADARAQANAVGTDPSSERAEEIRANELLADARAQAESILEQSEVRARERSGVVIAEAQARLDQLLAEERDVRARLESRKTSSGVGAGPAAIAPLGFADPTTDSRDRTEVAGPDVSLAEFMKATLRDEVRPD